jgi:hypothetical protein
VKILALFASSRQLQNPHAPTVAPLPIADGP